MSVRCQTKVWDLEGLTTNEKFLMIAISDHTNDEDFTCWPGNKHLAKKTGLGLRTIVRLIDKLCKMGLIEKIGNHPNSKNRILKLNLDNKSTSATMAQVPPNTNRSAIDDKKESDTIILTIKNHKGDLLPDWLNVDQWNEYKAMRKSIKKPLTPHAEKLAIKKLEKFKDEGQDIEEIINNSIFNSWQGLFPVKENKNKLNGQERTPYEL